MKRSSDKAPPRRWVKMPSISIHWMGGAEMEMAMDGGDRYVAADVPKERRKRCTGTNKTAQSILIHVVCRYNSCSFME